MNDPAVPRNPRCSDRGHAAGTVYTTRTCLHSSFAGWSISASSMGIATDRASPTSGLVCIAGPRFGDYPAGFRFGRLGYELVGEARTNIGTRHVTYMSFGNLVMPWTRHIRTGRDLVRRAFDAANEDRRPNLCGI